MSMRFPKVVDPEPFCMAAKRRHVEANGVDLDLHVRGEIGPILEAALAQHVVDLTSRHADLEELFLAYYRDNGEGSPS